MQAEEAQRQAQQQQWNAEMAKQVSEIKPFAQSSAIAGTRRSRSARWCTQTTATIRTPDLARSSWTQQVWPGPGNNSFNLFDITRAYLDFKFTPVDDVSLRVTPNMYADD